MTQLYHAVQLPLFSTKVCIGCHIEKLLDDFHNDKTRKDGHRERCKKCMKKTPQENKQHRERYHESCRNSERKYNESHREERLEYHRKNSPISYAKNIEKERVKHKEYIKANPFYRRERDARRTARKNASIIGKVSYKSILERDGMHCYICERGIEHHDLSFDHVIPLARGGSHIADNIKPVHMVCNSRKKTRLLSEMTPFQRRGIQ